MKKALPTVLLGLIFVIFSLQFFYMIFAGGDMPPMNPVASQFMYVLFSTGYVFVVKVLELSIGIMLLIPRTRRLALILIAPIVVNIILSEFLVVKPPIAQSIPALLVLVLNIVGIYQNRATYMPIVAKN